MDCEAKAKRAMQVKIRSFVHSKEGRRECNTSVYSDRKASNSQITGEQTKMFFYLIELSLLSNFAFFLLSLMIIFLLA